MERPAPRSDEPDSSVVRRFGPPAAINRRNGVKCVYYEVVGDGPFARRLCFTTGERPISAAGN